MMFMMSLKDPKAEPHMYIRQARLQLTSFIQWELR